ncbi:ABC transporter ATP-binding protein [Flavitalea sp. BT771]|uniref:ABC transporter ATP-binding protein n=1 Tax=Flavitalea sp. BT771 TaxID=3063329 RepID=UPI0026E479E0|nr:ABC transporter ATP-binding protein [Flavitalea sp. BT771]MDO6428973.1 ABC transporter ATP-binding protein [Flavitalea sp. BT771]MDV6218899.1 ABC transporter ATP-binding protein [Flavitalea sp. BT771]
MDILQVKDLKKYFSSQRAVDAISFSLQKGSIFGLLGPNGAGKTTLIRMITGIFYPDEGEILFEGRPFHPAKDIVHIGYMPEERGLYKKMKIGEQAVYLARLKGLGKQEATEKVREWFIKFEMQSWWNKKVEDLSKGMGQKLQFVTTVLHEPRLIILDEPFSGLDPVNSNLIKDEIYALARKGSTIIFSTHRMEQVEEICDHIILVNKGRKILDGSVAGVKQQFKENLFSIGLDDPDAASLTTTTAFEIVGRKEGHLIVKIREGYRSNDVLSHFINEGRNIDAFTEILPSLNDIFIRLVEGTPLARQFQPVTA